MKRLLFIIGVIVIIVGLVFYLVPSTLATVSEQTGVSTLAPTLSRTVYLSAAPGNYSAEQVTLNHNDILAASFQSDPSGIEFLLLNQGNYSLLQSGRGSASVQVYNQSRLNALNYNFTFTSPTAKSENYFLVFRAQNSTMSVLLNITVFSQQSLFDPLLITYAVLVIGLVLVLGGLFGGRRTRRAKVMMGGNPSLAPSGTAAPGPQGETVHCKFCNSPMSSNLGFCPSCGKAQK